MAASSSDEARGLSHAAKYRLLRELGSKDGAVWAALESSNGRTQLVVAERVSRGSVGEADIADWTRDAQRLAKLEHANVARIRRVLTRHDDVLVISDFVDGVRWSELVRAGQRPSLDVSLRVLTDVLSGLSAIHNLRDEKRQPLGLVHGQLSPEFIIVGLDGVTRVIGANHMRAAASSPAATASSYFAPEVLLADDAADPRADIYGVGVMLWEALSGGALFQDMVASAIVTQVLSGKVPRPTIPDEAPWAAPIVEVVARALRGEVAKRLGSAAAFAAELRRIAGPKLAPTVRVAAFVRAKYGDQIRARRTSLERGESVPEARQDAPEAETPLDSASIEVVVDVDDRASTMPPPPLAAPAPTPFAPLLPPLPRPPATTMRGVVPPPPRTLPTATAEAATPTPPLLAPLAPTPMPAPAPPPPRAHALAPPLPPALAPPPARPHTSSPSPALEPTPLPLPLPVAPSLPPNDPLSSPSESIRPARRSLRAVGALLLVACVAAGTLALVWSLSSGARTHSSNPPASIVTPPAAPPLPASTTPPAAVGPAPSEESANATEPSPPPKDEPPIVPSTKTSAPAENPSPGSPAPQPLVRPVAKKKYDPEGI